MRLGFSLWTAEPQGMAGLTRQGYRGEASIAAHYLKYGGLLNDLQLPDASTKSEPLIEID